MKRFVAAILISLLMIFGCKSLDPAKTDISSELEDSHEAIEDGIWPTYITEDVTTAGVEDTIVIEEPVMDTELLSEDTVVKYPGKSGLVKGEGKVSKKDPSIEELAIAEQNVKTQEIASQEEKQTEAVPPVEPQDPAFQGEEQTEAVPPVELQDPASQGEEQTEAVPPVELQDPASQPEESTNMTSDWESFTLNPLEDSEDSSNGYSLFVPVIPEELPSLIVDKDKDAFLEEEPVKQSENSGEPTPMTEVDPELYDLWMDHLGHLVISFDGSGWIYLTDLSSSKEGALDLVDKTYRPASGKTDFVFHVEVPEGRYKIVVMKQNLQDGNNKKYTISWDMTDLTEDTDSSEVSKSVLTSPAKGSMTVQPENEEIISGEMPPDIVSSTDANKGVVNENEKDFPEPSADLSLDGLGAVELMRLAADYEAPGPGQSLEKARTIYWFILGQYPVSVEKFQAEDRLRYLDRHYFKVQ